MIYQRLNCTFVVIKVAEMTSELPVNSLRVMKDITFPVLVAILRANISNIAIGVLYFSQFYEVSLTGFSDHESKVLIFNRHLLTVADRTLFHLPVLTAIFVYM